MSGECDVAVILQSLKPSLSPLPYVYVTAEHPIDVLLQAAVVVVKENQGTTIVLPQEVADRYQLTYEYVAAWITLDIHTELDGIGLTAAISTALARANISCNVVAGYYHDHLFVDYQDGDRAMKVLDLLSKR